MLKAHLIAGISVAQGHILKKYIFDTVSETNWYNWHLKTLQKKFCLFFGYTPVPCRAIHLLRYIVFPRKNTLLAAFLIISTLFVFLHLQYIWLL